MPKGTREARQGTVIETQGLILGGASDAQVFAHLTKKNPDTGVQRFSLKTARRYVKLAYAGFNRDAKRSNRVWLSVGLAKRGFAQRRALGRQKFMLVGGQIERLDDPDVATYLASVESEAKLLGLNAPERHELVVESFRQMFTDLVMVLREEVHDSPLLLRIVSRLRSAMEGSARQAVSSNATGVSAALASAALEVRAASHATIDVKAIDAKEAESKPPPHGTNGSTNGTNGHTNGDAK